MVVSEPKQKIEKLVDKYQKLSAKERPQYNEANTKNVFVQPLFEALGWDFSDIKQVEAEKTIVKGRVDFVCKLNGVSKFCLELKPLRDDLTDDDRKQAISYAYNKGVTWAVLTNFDKLQVFNAEFETKELNNVLFLNLTWKDYLPSFDELWLLSQESVGEGLLDKQAAKYGKLRARVPIEKRLYQHLREYREKLFNEIYGMNKDKGITLGQTDSLIQELFNRLLFIRTAEDRNLAGNHPLLAALHQWRNDKKKLLIEAVREIFRKFTELYDSDLFPATFDAWEQIWVESYLLADLIQGLYEVPGDFARYDFSAIDADVLGQVYEQYLGYVAQATKELAKQQQLRLDMGLPGEEVIKVEEKRERRKAAGIYYTPRWVTDYIVKQTVGRFLQERSYNEILNVKIVDPACGSGSFLIRAYDELLNYHAKVKKITVAELEWAERIAILTRNIFGVDLDPQAVEITKLNLLLRALAKAEALPPLANNIQCGNSLISGTEEELRQCFGDNFKDKKPFNWEERFPDIMKNGGFDIVIGNPPYVGFHGFQADKPYLRGHYKCAVGRFDLYMPFIEQGLQLLRQGGRLGFICPTNFMKRQHGEVLRELLKRTCEIENIVDFGHSQVFLEALNYTCILIVRKRQPSMHMISYAAGESDGAQMLVEQAKLSREGWIFRPEIEKGIAERIHSQPVIALGDIVEGIYEGIVTGQNAVFVLSKDEVKKLGLEQALMKPAVQGRHVERYYLQELTHMVLYPYRAENSKAKPIPEEIMEHDFPRAYLYLRNKIQMDYEKGGLRGRAYFNKSSKLWYELWNQRSFNKQATRKIVVQEIASGAKFALSDEGQFYLDTVSGIVPKDKSPSNLYFLLGLLNSHLLEHYYKHTTVPKAGGFYIYKNMYLRLLPIRRIDFSNPAEKKMHDDLVALVERMLTLHRKLAEVNAGGKDIFGEEKKEIEKEIAKTDQKIDLLVYELYGITEAEKQVIEASFVVK